MSRSKVSAASGRSAARPSARSRKPDAKAAAKGLQAQKDRVKRKPAARAASLGKQPAAVKSAPPAKPRRAAAPAASERSVAKVGAKKPAAKKSVQPRVVKAAPEHAGVERQALQLPEARATEPRIDLSEPLQAAAIEPPDTDVGEYRLASEPVGFGASGDLLSLTGSDEGECVAVLPAGPDIPTQTVAEPPRRDTADQDAAAEAVPAPPGAAADRESLETALRSEADQPRPEAMRDTSSEPLTAPAPPPESAAEPEQAGAEPAGEVIPFRRPAQFERAVIERRAGDEPETFHEGDFVVYPTHGVGKVERIAVEEIAGHKLELIHITFEENRMTLRVPVAKARSAGLRRLASRPLFDEALAVLKGRARIKRTMWSRRAQEYEAKINSGDPLAIAEVVRDLHRNAGQPDQSFSERQIYEAAMDRLAAEMAALEQTDKPTAIARLGEYLKTPDLAKTP